MKRRWAYGVAFVSGVTLSFAYPEPSLWPLAWVGVAPFLALGRGVRPGRGALLGAAFGIGFFGTLLVWISIAGWVAWGVLVALQTAFVAAFGALWGPTSGRVRTVGGRVCLAAVLWAGMEYARGVLPGGGFTWGQPAQSQNDLEWMLRYASVGGSVVLSMVVVAINALVAEAATAARVRRWGTVATTAGAALFIVAAPLVFPSSSATGRSIEVTIVQGNVPDLPDGLRKELEIIESHARLTRGLDAAPDLVVWPESSVGLDIERTPAAADAVAGAARTVAAPMVIGGNLDRSRDRYAVMAFEVSPEGEIVDRYQKTHLVPFGEYVPGRRFLEWLPMIDQVPRDAIAGDEKTVFDVAGGAVAPVLSFEGDFGSLVRGRIAAGGRLLIVGTNTSTWNHSWGSAQHVAFSQLRAAENGVWVVHAAISGISAFVSPRGEVVAATELFEPKTLSRNLRFAEAITPYARWGDLILLLVSIAALVPVVGSWRKVAR